MKPIEVVNRERGYSYPHHCNICDTTILANVAYFILVAVKWNGNRSHNVVACSNLCVEMGIFQSI
jgi:hypothetical protein